MPLESLLSLLAQLKGRIEQHGPLLRQSEALTRYVLIDPLLRELGWDTEDPDKVRPEYRDSGGSADYALFLENRPVALVEAKKLGEPLAAGIEQALNYCNRQGINYMIVPDGNHWEMYEVFRQARIEDRKLTSISVHGEGAYQSALKALHLWQPNLGSGTSISPPPELIIATTPVETYQPPRVGDDSPIVTPPPTPPTTRSTPGWTPIKDLHLASGAKAPSAIRFPGGEEKRIKYWKYVLVEVAEWLIRNNSLTAPKCPIGRGYDRYIVHTQSRHSSGKDFFQPERLSKGLFLETNVSARNAVDDARFLIEKLAGDSTGIELQLT